jgi:lipopolysaccharide biosynthesis glycosyltransferase
MLNNKISIIVASDNHFAILIAALLKSIDLNHKSQEHIDFYIIDDGISPKNKLKLSNLVSKDRFTLIWINSKDILPIGVEIPIDTSSWPLTTYFKIFAPYVVDQNLERLIYLDVDIIVQSDIVNLWQVDMDEYILAAAQDITLDVTCEWAGIPNYKELGIAPNTLYFNAGVLLIKPKEWREQKVAEQIMEVLEKYKKSVVMGDQYGLNVVMANQWKQLDPKWNWFAANECPDPYLIHFLAIKPIFTSYNSQPIFQKYFFEYLKVTPWANFKPISGNWRLARKLYNKVIKRLKILLLKFK